MGKVLFITALGYWICSLCVTYLVSIPILNFAVSTLGILALTYSFEGKLLKKIFVTVSVAILNAGCDIVSYIILGKFMENMRINVSFIFTILLVLVCEQIIGSIVNRKNAYITPDKFGILILIPVCSMMILYVVSAEDAEWITEVVTAIVILVINALVFYIYHKMIENYMEKIKLQILEERTQAYANEIQIMSRSQNKIQAIRHDMRHHIIELKGLLNGNKISDVENYLKEMENALNITGEYVHSGNYEIDSLLNYLLQDANEKLEDVKVKLQIPREMEFNTFKFNIIIGNLLENAIEAAWHSKKKELQLDIRYEQGVLHIQIINSYEGELKKNGDTFITTKDNKENHGIGLKNVREIVEEDNGSFVVETADNLFKVNIMIYL